MEFLQEHASMFILQCFAAGIVIFCFPRSVKQQDRLHEDIAELRGELKAAEFRWYFAGGVSILMGQA
jgi:hypothetical protein